ncbi:MAG: prephenate dehydrogenase/arogenate dehydrogenase family protein, partial [Lachnospiraceae bacterium]|nr:prephenate dehydrogenase/arogenate dehydrogenase family protein [Lachnospiraceae bacterium]
MLSNTAGIIGLGLIGGSLAKSIKKQDPDCRITAYDTDRASLLQAQLAGDIDAIAEKIDESFADCDIIFLCAPVSVNLKYMELVKPYLKDDAILTDVGSTKTGIMERAAELGLQKYFIGGHPMAGSERSGYANASDLLFENAFYIITPFQETHAKKQLRLIEFVHRIPALPMVMEAEEHDRTVATVSHIPHIIAFALVNLLRDSDDLEGTMRRIAAGGFKDITRIANSSPEMWEAICM